MRLDKSGMIVIPENEYELIWYSMYEWNFKEQKLKFGRAYARWVKGGGKGVF